MPERQKVLKICENRNIDRVDLPKLGFFVRDQKTLEAWYCLRNFLQRIQPFKGQYWLPVDERYAMPISPYADIYYTPEQIEELTDQNQVADAACNFTRLETDLQHRKSRYYDFLGIAIMGIVVVFIIIALLAASGRVDFGAITQGFTGGG